MALRMVILLAGTLAIGMVALNIFGFQQQPPRTFEDLRDQVVYNTARLDTMERDVMQLRRGDSNSDVRVLQNELTNHRQRVDEIERHLESAVSFGIAIIAGAFGIFWFLVRRWVASMMQRKDHASPYEEEER